MVADADGRNVEVLPPANVAGFAWSPDGTKVLLKIYTNSNTGQIDSYDLASGAVSPLGQGVIDGDGSWQLLSPRSR